MTNFLHKLADMIKKEDPSVIGWSEDGWFEIRNMEEFKTNIIKKYFRHDKMASFIRQLSYYNFKKDIQKGKFRYRNIHFPNNMELIIRRNAITKGPKKPRRKGFPIEPKLDIVPEKIEDCDFRNNTLIQFSDFEVTLELLNQDMYEMYEEKVMCDKEAGYCLCFLNCNEQCNNHIILK